MLEFANARVVAVHQGAKKVCPPSCYSGDPACGRTHYLFEPFLGCTVYLHNLLVYRGCMDERRAYPLILIAIILALITGATGFVWAALVGIALLIARPSTLALPAHILESVARFVGTWVSNAALALIFFIIVVPYSYVYRALEPGRVRDFFHSTGDSFYHSVQRVYKKEDFEKTW